MSLEELEELMTPEDFQEYERLYFMGEEYLSPQWYTTQDMMQDILANYGLNNPSDPYGMGEEES